MSENEDDFAAMFEASIKTRRLEPGQTVEGTIVAIGDEVAFVDVGAKGEATIALDERSDCTSMALSHQTDVVVDVNGVRPSSDATSPLPSALR